MNINSESYNKICEQWSRCRDNSPINKCIVEFANILKPYSKVLDIGCGTGYPIAAFLSEKGFTVTGIDISEKMIEKARSHKISNAEFSAADILSYHTKDKFDGIIAFDSIWHIPEEHQEKIYKIVADLLKDEGYFLFTHGKRSGSTDGEMFGEKFRYSALDVKEVHRQLNNNGFVIETCIEDYTEKTTGSRDLFVVARKSAAAGEQP